MGDIGQGSGKTKLTYVERMQMREEEALRAAMKMARGWVASQMTTEDVVEVERREEISHKQQRHWGEGW